MKILKRLALVLVLFVVLALGALTVLVPPAAKKAVEGGTSYALGVPASLDKVLLGVSPGTSEVGLQELLVSNPAGFGDEGVLDLGRASVKVNTFSLLSDVIEVPEIRLENVELRVVQNGKESNLMALYRHLSSLGGGAAGGTDTPDAGGDAPDAGAEDPGPRMRIGRVHLSGIAASFDLRGVPGIADRYRFELPPFELDLSDRGPQDMAGLLESLLDELSTRGLERAKQELDPSLAALLDGGALTLDGVQQRALEVLGQKGAELEQAADEGVQSLREDLESGKDPEQALKDAADKAKKGLGGLLEGGGR